MKRQDGRVAAKGGPGDSDTQLQSHGASFYLAALPLYHIIHTHQVVVLPLFILW